MTEAFHSDKWTIIIINGQDLFVIIFVITIFALREVYPRHSLFSLHGTKVTFRGNLPTFRQLHTYFLHCQHISSSPPLSFPAVLFVRKLYFSFASFYAGGPFPHFCVSSPNFNIWKPRHNILRLRRFANGSDLVSVLLLVYSCTLIWNYYYLCSSHHAWNHIVVCDHSMHHPMQARQV